MKFRWLLISLLGLPAVAQPHGPPAMATSFVQYMSGPAACQVAAVYFDQTQHKPYYCYPANTWVAFGGSSSGVTQLIAGTNITLDPSGGTGAVTINATGGGSGPVITATADTDLAAGTGVSINSSGHAQQTWGPAPNIAGVVTAIPATTAVNNVNGIVAAFDADNFLAWVYGTNGSSVAAIVPITRSGTSLAVGTVDSSDFASAGFGMVIPLAFPNFVVIGNVGTPTVTPASVSGGVISPGSSLGTLSGGAACGTYLDSTTFIVVTTDGQVTPSTTSTLGTPVQVGSGSIGFCVSFRLSTTSFAIVYNDEGNSNTVTGVVGTDIANTIVLGTPVALSGATNPTFSQPVVLSPTSIAIGWSQQIGGAAVPAFQAAAASISSLVLTWGSAVTVSTFAQSAQTSFPNNGAETPLFSATDIDGTHGAFGGGSVLPQIFTVSGGNNLSVPTAIPLNNVGSPASPAVVGAGFLLESIGGAPVTVSPSTLSINSVVSVSEGLMVADATSRVYEVDASGNQSPSIQHAGLWNYGLTPADSTDVVAWFFDFNNNFQARIIAAEPINLTPPVGITASAVSASGTATITPVGSVGGLSGLTPGTQYYYNGDGTITAGNTGHPAGVALTSSTLAVK